MTQPLIKILLLAAFAVVAFYAVRGSRREIHRVVWRTFVIGALLAAVGSVVFPDALTWVANKVGVGRGADLLLYMLVVTVTFVSVVQFRRISQLERRYTELVRTVAIREALHSDDMEARAKSDPGERSSTDRGFAS